jgi:hypothetical protein
VRYWAIVLTLAGSVAHGAEDGGMERTLTLPHPLAPGTIAWLQVQVGPLAPGQRVRVTTRSGELLGAVSPFGAAERRQSGIYSLAIPPGAIRDDALAVIVTITDANNPPRAPTSTEVQSLKLLTPDAAR